MSVIWFARWLSMSIGFLSLSQEILFVRTVGFVHHSTPRAFALVLFFFLFGIAVGAHVGKRWCADKTDPTRMLAGVLLLAGLIDLLIPYVTSRVAVPEYDFLIPIGIFVVAALKSTAFPVAHYLGSEESGGRLGRSVSKVYFCNIVGATLGPLITGFVLLQFVSLEHAYVVIAIGTLLLAAWCAVRSQFRLAGWVSAAIAVASPVLLVQHPSFIQRIVQAEDAKTRVAQVVENRSGIIHVVHEDKGGDKTFGGNVFDGRMNTDLRINSNGVHRVYVLSGLHPAPRRILVIGMSSGAWTEVLARMADVEHIEVIEINSGYLDVVSRYPEVSGILTDPKISIHIDDGRRWLRSHKDTAFDLIVMNTTFHWRAYSTNLLSVEFLTEVRQHLRPGGIAMFNSTGSADAFRTATEVFAFVRGYGNCVYVSDHDFVAGIESNRANLWRHGTPEAPTFDRGNPADRMLIDGVLDAKKFVTLAQAEHTADRKLEVITDANMLTEFKYGSRQILFPGFD